MIRADISLSKLALVLDDFSEDEIKTFAENHSVLIHSLFSLDTIHTLTVMIPKERVHLINVYMKEKTYLENDGIVDFFISYISRNKYVKLNLKEN